MSSCHSGQKDVQPADSVTSCDKPSLEPRSYRVIKTLTPAAVNSWRFCLRRKLCMLELRVDERLWRFRHGDKLGTQRFLVESIGRGVQASR